MMQQTIGAEFHYPGPPQDHEPRTMFDQHVWRGKKQVVKVIVADGDSDHAMAICRYLTLSGMAALPVSSRAGLDSLMGIIKPDLIVLDANLPDDDGFFVAARIRAAHSVGIIMLTTGDRLENRVLALSVGADACMEKPIQFRELDALLFSLARRLSRITPTEDEEAPAVESVTDRGWGFDSTNWSLIAPNGTQVELTNAEYLVTQTLISEPGKPQSRDAILAVLGRTRHGYNDRSLDAVVARLRRKVSTATNEDIPIRSARGIGYVFAGRVQTN